MAELVFECSVCGKHLCIDERGAGKSIACPDCQHEVSIPEPALTHRCSSCNADIAIPAAFRGRTINCPKCDHRFLVSLKARHIRRSSSSPSANTSAISARSEPQSAWYRRKVLLIPTCACLIAIAFAVPLYLSSDRHALQVAVAHYQHKDFAGVIAKLDGLSDAYRSSPRGTYLRWGSQLGLAREAYDGARYDEALTQLKPIPASFPAYDQVTALTNAIAKKLSPKTSHETPVAAKPSDVRRTNELVTAPLKQPHPNKATTKLREAIRMARLSRDSSEAVDMLTKALVENREADHYATADAQTALADYRDQLKPKTASNEQYTGPAFIKGRIHIRHNGSDVPLVHAPVYLIPFTASFQRDYNSLASKALPLIRRMKSESQSSSAWLSAANALIEVEKSRVALFQRHAARTLYADANGMFAFYDTAPATYMVLVEGTIGERIVIWNQLASTKRGAQVTLDFGESNVGQTEKVYAVAESYLLDHDRSAPQAPVATRRPSAHKWIAALGDSAATCGTVHGNWTMEDGFPNRDEEYIRKYWNGPIKVNVKFWRHQAVQTTYFIDAKHPLSSQQVESLLEANMGASEWVPRDDSTWARSDGLGIARIKREESQLRDGTTQVLTLLELEVPQYKERYQFSPASVARINGNRTEQGDTYATSTYATTDTDDLPPEWRDLLMRGLLSQGELSELTEFVVLVVKWATSTGQERGQETFIGGLIVMQQAYSAEPTQENKDSLFRYVRRIRTLILKVSQGTASSPAQNRQAQVREYVESHYPTFVQACSTVEEAANLAQSLNSRQQGTMDAAREMVVSGSGGGSWVGNFRYGNYTFTYDATLDSFIVYQD